MNPAAVQTEVVSLLRQWERRPRHAFHVAGLALQLFDELAPLHGLGERERVLLEAAACLHDIGGGSDASGREHHHESARLIRAHPWQSLSPAEVELVAEIARYHRKELPQADHAEFAGLSPADQELVRTLAALVRVADGLDRSHERLIGQARAEIGPDRVTLRLRGSPRGGRELDAAAKKADLAQQVFRRQCLFVLEPDED